MKKIIILIPVFNDWKSLNKLLMEINKNIQFFKDINFECLIVNDASTSQTPELNKPKRSSGPRKYVVYVKDPKTGNVKKINFGDAKGGLTAKINDRDAARSFAARHNCDTKTDKLSAGYWACRLPKYAKELGLKGGGSYFW